MLFVVLERANENGFFLSFYLSTTGNCTETGRAAAFRLHDNHMWEEELQLRVQQCDVFSSKNLRDKRSASPKDV